MPTNIFKPLAIGAIASLCAACGNSTPTGATSNTDTSAGSVIKDPVAAQCVIQSPLNLIGSTKEMSVNGVTYTRTHRPDAPGPLETPIPNPGPQPEGSCKGSTQYRYGSGIYDDTGPVGGDPTGHADLAGMVAPNQAINGIHTRLYARAFAVESPCNGKRVVFVSDEHAFVTGLVRQEVLKAVAADPVLSQFYGPDNVMLSATHTHAANGGFGVGSFPADPPTGTPQEVRDAYNYAISAGDSPNHFDADNFNVMIGGIVQAIRRAHANLEAHPQSAQIKLSVGELLNANTNRDPPAYQQNSPAERTKFSNADGHDITVDKRFLQLSFVRGDGSAVGALNWFGVHPTTMHYHDRLISSDSKGVAGLGFERLMGTRYEPDAGALNGADNFVAAFAQTDEGNSVPDLFVFDADVDGGNGVGQGVPYRYRFGTDDAYALDDPLAQRGAPKAALAFGTKQLTQALKQFGAGSALSGPVDYRFFYVDMSAIAIDDPAVADTLAYPDLPADLYADPKATCSSALGEGFLAGGVNGPQFGAPGFVCVNDAPIPYQNSLRTDYNGLYNGTGGLEVMKNDVFLTVPVDGVALFTASTPLVCEAARLQSQYDCQNEKPVLVGGLGGAVAPFQIFRLGSLAVLGIPWEVTTMSARRLRQTVLDALSPVGVDTVVIAGLSNAYFQYMATREEYTAQMYEGGSTLFGPWQLAAVQQESRKLALTLASGNPAPEGAAAPGDVALGDPSPITTDQDADFGAIVTDAAAAYHQGDTVDVSWVAGYPGNDLKTMSSYLYVERRNASGGWDVVATDKDPELLFIWNWASNPVTIETHVVDASTAQAVWTIPLNAAAGTYRIRHEGVSRASTDAAPTPYSGMTREFAISGTPAACP